ncbi:MAG: S8 family peptidase [Pseudomonadota bacterium]
MVKVPHFAHAILLASAVLLPACGGAGGATTAVPVSPTTTTTTPEPTPAPQPINFDTAEYRRSNGLDNINAIPAYEQGGTGEGVILAVIDSGIDRNGLEFAGRIHPNSTNTADPGEDFQDIDGHGSFVASVAAGAKDDARTHGVAFDAQILALRTDSGQSCLSDDGCSHFDSDIAEALDIARTTGAKVANVSLGGGGASFALRQAIDRATDDGMIIIISSGNDGEANPDAFALAALDDRADGQVLIAGYTNDQNVIDPNSNRAGIASDVFVVAPGSDIRATGLDNDEFFVSGSSFSAPHVSGAIAVLYDLFPNLTAEEMVELITTTATDLGDPGVDAIYGHGLINLEEAIQPQGTMQVTVQSTNGDAGTLAPLVDTPAAPSAFGDALGLGLASTTTTGYDRFRRPYDVNLGAFAVSAQPIVALGDIVDTRRQFARSRLSDDSGMITAQFAVQQDTPLPQTVLDAMGGAFADRADDRTVVADMLLDLGKFTFATSFNQRPDATVTARQAPTLLSLADSDARQYGIGSAPADVRMTSLYALGAGWHVGVTAARDEQLWEDEAADFGQFETGQLAQAAITTQWTNNRLALQASLGVIDERGQILGAQANRGALSLGTGAQSNYAQVGSLLQLGDGLFLEVGAAFARMTLADADQSLLNVDGALGVSSWQSRLVGAGLFDDGDRFSVTLRQPQRVESGAAQLTTAGLQTQFSLAPTGRQIDTEMAYEVNLAGAATLSANVLMRQDSGHVAGQDDVAGLLRLTSQF